MGNLSRMGIIIGFIFISQIKIILKDRASFQDSSIIFRNDTLTFPLGQRFWRNEVEEIKFLPPSIPLVSTFKDTLPISLLLEKGKQLSCKYRDANGVIIFEKDVAKLHPDGKRTYRYHFIGKILSPETKRKWGNVSIAFDETREKVNILLGRTIHPDGSVTPLDKNKIKISLPRTGMVHFSKEFKRISFALDNVNVGDIVEYAYEAHELIPYDTMRFNLIWRARGTEPIGHSIFKVIIPDTMELNICTKNFKGKPKITTMKEEKIYMWEVKDIPPIIQETRMPPIGDVVPTVWVTTLKNWTPYFKRERRWKKERLQVTPKIKEKVEKIIEDKPTIEDKMGAIYHWVQRNIRYISIKGSRASGMTGHPAEVTLERGFGDCTDKAGLLVTMFKVIGVEAYPVTVTTNTSSQTPYTEIPLPWGNHEIVEVHLEGKRFYLDPVSENYRYPYFNIANHGVYCFNSLTNKVNYIEVPPPEWNSRNIELEIELKNDSLYISTYRYYTGGIEAGIRGYWRGVPVDEKKERVEELINGYIPGAELIEFEIGPTEELEDTFYLKWKYRGTNYGIRAKDLWILRLPEYEEFRFNEIASEERKYDIVYTTTYKLTHRIKVKLNNYKIEWLPEKIEISFPPYVSYIAKYHTKEGELIFTSEFRRERRIVKQKDYKKYKEFLEKMVKYSKQPIILKKHET